MTAAVTPQAVDRFRALLGRHFGLAFDDTRVGFLAEVLQRRLGRQQRTADAYLDTLGQAPPPAEIAALAAEVTVTETYFFRNGDQFRALAERVMAPPGRPLSLLSAGCASGEEAYTLAMVARAALPERAAEIRIRAVDINPAMLEKAARGRYYEWSLRDTPAEMRRKWFKPSGTELILDPEIRKAVHFEARNLSVDDPDLWLHEAYDAVFCRNVLMYFAPDRMRAAITRIAGSLRPDGFLFLGHAETLRGVSDEFHLCHTHGTFYYQRKGAGAPIQNNSAGAPIQNNSAGAPIQNNSMGAPVRHEPVPRPAAVTPAAAPPDTSWIDAIRGASARVTALTSGSRPGPSASVPAWDPAPALDLFRRERFAEALRHVQARPKEWAGDPDALLLEAMLLTHDGQIPAAETACRALLAIDEMNAGAHYVLALCEEHAGRLDAAIEHDRVAAYLDPGFAMPRLHLGLLARRAGSRDEARRELTQALFLFEREEAARLLLFGGGFNRAALVALCEAALKESGGRT
jgi:chemotaxis protein methyltransferase CheR